jgi:hypothetical protein
MLKNICLLHSDLSSSFYSSKVAIEDKQLSKRKNEIHHQYIYIYIYETQYLHGYHYAKRVKRVVLARFDPL